LKLSGNAGLALKVSLVAILALVALGASDNAARFDRDSHSMMCVCGCEELLGECNHVGCPDSDRMRRELALDISQGKSDDTIFHEFQTEYGPVVLAAPMFTPFNHLAWIVPPLALFCGIGLAMFFIRKWKSRSADQPRRKLQPGQQALRDRIRNETQL
jgi:cytochrome c-type biogenesis protein CcmH